MRFASSFTVVLAVYWLYALTAVRFLEPQARLRSSGPVQAGQAASTSEMARRQGLAALFGPDAWELASPKVLETEQGQLLFEDYRTLPGGQMEVKPLTLIFQSKKQADDDKPVRPIVMRAPEGAVLNFDNELDLSRAEIGKLVGGRLLGEIHIFSPESEPGADDRLDIRTKHVQITESRVWTVHPVAFRMGQSHGSGRDLTIVLLPQDSGSSSKTASSFGALKTLSLVHVDKFVIDAGGAGKLMSSTPGDSVAAAPPQPGQATADNNEGPIEISCDGPFQFDFVGRNAWFKRNVDVFKHYPDGPSDSLACQYLLLEFDEKKDDPASSTSPGDTPASDKANDDEADDNSKFSAQLDLRRIVAVGQPVKLEAPSRDASAIGNYLEFTTVNNRVHLAGDQQVALRQGSRWMYARQLEYELSETHKFGPVWAEGPGRIEGQAPVPSDDGGKADQPFEVTWKKSLRIEPAEAGQYLLTLDDSASVRVEPFGGFSAAQMFVWFHEAPVFPDPASPALASSPDGVKTQMQIDRMVALGQVRIDSPRLTGSTQRFEAFVRQADPSIPLAPGDDSMRPPVGSAATSSGPGNGLFGASGEAQSRFDVSGDLVRVDAVQSGKVTVIDNIAVSGNARVKETQTEKLGEAPLVVTGDTLEVKKAQSPQTFLQVIGQPATVSARGMVAKGGNIQLDRGRNQLWINGPGSMTLPLVSARQQAGQNGSPTQETSSHKLAGLGQTPPWVTIAWRRRMDFDGVVARFLEEVHATTESQQVLTGMLEVAFDQRVDFADPKKNDKAQARRFTFSNGVVLKNRTEENNAVTAFDQLQAGSLLIDQLTGELHADGPGWISSARYGNVQQMSPGPLQAPAQPAAGAVAAAAKPAELNYLKVEFQKEVVGNIHRREIDLYGKVKTVYGPIARWDEVLLIDRPESFGSQGVQVTCDHLNLVERGPQITPSRKAFELLAQGNVYVERPTMTARADRLSYTESKDLLVLRGDGRNDAEITQQARIGDEWSHASARIIYYWRSLNQIRVDDAEELDLTNFGALNSSSSRR
ncbi:hypothetical protein [Lignipirellula cremea]|nr:hypothetical protein [Lignipirellula cremea]